MSDATGTFWEVSIPAAAGVSAAVDLRGTMLSSIELPDALTGSTIVLEHRWNEAEANWSPVILWPDTTQWSIPFVARGLILVPAGQFATLGLLRFVAGTSASPTAQAAARRFRLGRRAL